MGWNAHVLYAVSGVFGNCHITSCIVGAVLVRDTSVKIDLYLFRTLMRIYVAVEARVAVAVVGAFSS